MLTVKQIQKILFTEYRAKGWIYFSTNTKAFKYEADMIGVTRSKVVTEFEIKRSRSDYFSEIVNKKEKHYYLSKGKLVPNYFYFVCEEGLIKKDEVPVHCGLIYIKENMIKQNKLPSYTVRVIKDAAKLHLNKITDYNIILILRSIMYKHFENLI